MKWFLFFLLICSPSLYAEEQVTHSSLQGSWVYYYISKDSFNPNKPVVTEQRLIFTSGEDVTLNIAVRDNEYIQNTSYTLKFALMIRNNTPYLSLYSPESSEVLGAYLRMPVKNGLELSPSSNFKNGQVQLYRRNSIIMPGQFSTSPKKPQSAIQLP